MRAIRTAGVALAVLWIVGGTAAPAHACPMCGRGAASQGSAAGSPATAFAAAGFFLLALPPALAGAYGLLLYRTLSSAGSGERPASAGRDERPTPATAKESE